MKRFYFLLALCSLSLATSIAFGQSITLSFTGQDSETSGYIKLDSILIRNVTQEADTFLFGQDTTIQLLLGTSVSMNMNFESTFELSQNYPNPFTDHTNFVIKVFEKANYNIVLINILGQSCAVFDGNFDVGIHAFTLSGMHNRFNILSVRNSKETKSIKLVGSKQTDYSQPIIKYAGYQQLDTYKNIIKSIMSISDFPFEFGDKLQFVGYSSGYELSAIYDYPTGDTNHIFQFTKPDTLICGQPFTDKRDGKTYATVQIGGQCWMAENLNVGIMISGDQQHYDNNTLEKYCYNNDEDNCNTLGGLYQWDEMMQYDTIRYNQGICPEGWHLPMISEWNELIDYAGGPMNAGAELKVGGSTGFDALMTGYRDDNSLFTGLGLKTHYWTSVQDGAGLAYYNHLTQSFSAVSSGVLARENGHAVRCVKGLAPLIKENVVVIDTTIYELISDSIELSQGTYIYQYNSKRKADDIILSDVIIGVTGEGYLRKITSVYDQPPILTLETVQSTFEDIFDQGEFDISFTLDSVPLKKQTSGFNYLLYSFPFINLQSLTVDINEYTLDLEVDMNMKIKIKDGVLQTFEFTQQIALDNTVEIEVDANQATNLNYSQPLPFGDIIIGIYPFQLGPIPGLASLSFDVNAGASIEYDNQLYQLFNSSSSEDITIGFKYDYGQWSKIWQEDHQTNLNTVSSEIQNSSIKFSVGPELAFKLYGVIGPYVNMLLYLDYTSHMTSSPLNKDAELEWGAEANGGVIVGVFGITFAEFNLVTFNLFNESLWRLPEEVMMIAGNNQVGSPNQVLPDPIIVKVVDSEGDVFSNIPVHFNITQGDGTLSNYEVMTNSAGLAQTSWTLGSSTGTQVMSASVQQANENHIISSPMIFSAETTTGSGFATVTTAPISDITQTTATCGGNVINDGGSAVTARGVCWDSSPSPTISHSHTIDGSGTGSFISYITVLTPNTEYYVRAYATNDAGTAYGNQQVFETAGTGAPCPGMPTFADSRDGQTYTTVLIGNQCWMKENLKYLPAVVGPDTYSETDPYYYVYDYNGTNISAAKATANFQNYGALYNWPASLTACPTGWHLPSDAEWTQLTNYVADQGYPNYNVTNGAANALKSCRQVNSPLGGDCNTSEHPRWDAHATAIHYGFDEFGFSAFPGGGVIAYDGFLTIGAYGYWWTSTETTPVAAWCRSVNSLNGGVRRLGKLKGYGHSVRCLRD